MKTFDEYRNEISIIQVAEYLGYKLNKSKGLKTPTYQLFDKNEKKLDEIVINNPNNNSNQYYFDRNRNGGDVVSFIKNHLDDFPSFQHQNNFVRINMILGHFSNTPYEPAQAIKNVTENKPFDVKRYEINPSSIKSLKYLSEERKISKETLEEFAPFIVMVSDKESKYNYTNVGFPYTVPGKENEITNLELRNYNFKGMGVNGDKRNSVWIATRASNPNNVKNVYFGESAIDVISYYQLNKSKISLENSALVSVGGYVSKNQIKNSLNHFNRANIHTLFDNDKNGNLYDVMTFLIANKQEYELKINKDNKDYHFKVGEKKHFSIPENRISLTNIKYFLNLEKDVTTHKPKFANDWNDLIRGKYNNAVHISVTETESVLIGGTVKEMASKTLANKNYQYLVDEGTRNLIGAYIKSNPNLKETPLTAQENTLISEKLNKEGKQTANSYEFFIKNSEDKVSFDGVLNAIVSSEEHKNKKFNIQIEGIKGKKEFSISHKDYDSVKKIRKEIDIKMNASQKKNNSYRLKL